MQVDSYADFHNSTKGTKMNSRTNTSEQVNDPRFIEAVRGSVDQIWQAGLGAFAKAQHEGEEMFARMVQEGADVQRRVQHLAGERLTGLSGTVARMAGSLGVQASGSWERLENVFEDRMSRSLHRLGVPTRRDIEALGTQIGELQKSVDALVAKSSAQKAMGKKPLAKGVKKQAEAKLAKTMPVKRAARVPTRRTSVSAASRG